MQQALEQAAHEAEGRLARQYERLLAEAHEAEEHAIQVRMQCRVAYKGTHRKANCFSVVMDPSCLLHLEKKK